MATVVLSLLAATCWGAGDFNGGLLSRRIGALTVLLGVEAIALAAAAIALAASGARVPGTAALAWGLGAGAAGAVGLVLLYRAMALGQISVVAPISACGAGLPVLVGLASGEDPGAAALAGIAIALVGCVLVAREQGAGNGNGQGAVGLALLATVGIGIYLLGMDRATEEAAIWWPLLLSRVGSFGVALTATLVRRGPLPAAADVPALALVGLADFGGSALYTAASAQGLLTLAAVLAALYPVVSVLLARGLLGERLTRPQLAGIALALSGVCLMATY
jgi:drug/metabolite transporter (DMT)-like permease